MRWAIISAAAVLSVLAWDFAAKLEAACHGLDEAAAARCSLSVQAGASEAAARRQAMGR